jgi:arsenite-transporting ATPase
MQDNLPHFLQRPDLRLLLFGGKGGVGKTTCAAAAGLHLATRFPGQSFLVASTDPAHSLRHSFAASCLPPNLHLLEIDAREGLRRFKAAHGQHLRQIAERGTFFDDDDLTRLLDLSLPGLDELMAFEGISALMAEGAYSCIVVDTAPTGHTLRFLGLPKVLRAWLAALDAMLAKHRYLTQLYRGSARKDDAEAFLENLAASVERLALLLSDSRCCRFVPVLLAETLSTRETRRLVDSLEALGIPVGDMLVNRLVPAAADCPVCRELHAQQGAELGRIGQAFAAYPLWGIPLLEAEVRGAEPLFAFWNGLRRLDELGKGACRADRAAAPR